MFGRANYVISPLLDESPPAAAPVPMMAMTIAVVAVVPMSIVAIVPAVIVGLLHIRILGRRSLHVAEVYSGRRLRGYSGNA
jgi:hypothetical protein